MSMLSKVEIFAGLSEEEQAALENSCVTRNYPRNTVVINENDFADSLYVIESGRVKVYCSDKNGKEYIMNTLGPGDYFGELALLDDDRRSASVRTLEKCTFTIIFKDEFHQSGLIGNYHVKTLDSAWLFNEFLRMGNVLQEAHIRMTT